MGLLQHIGQFFATLGLLFSAHTSPHQGVISQSQTLHQPEQRITEQPASRYQTLNATGDISYQGHNIHMKLSIPTHGGIVTGNLTGDCQGDILGQYDGVDNGVITGHTAAMCHVFLIDLPATATFTGTVGTVQKSVQLQVIAKAGSLEKSQTVTLEIQE